MIGSVAAATLEEETSAMVEISALVMPAEILEEEETSAEVEVLEEEETSAEAAGIFSRQPELIINCPHGCCTEPAAVGIMLRKRMCYCSSEGRAWIRRVERLRVISTIRRRTTARSSSPLMAARSRSSLTSARRS